MLDTEVSLKKESTSLAIPESREVAIPGPEDPARVPISFFIIIVICGLCVASGVARLAANHCRKRRASPPASREVTPEKVTYGARRYTTIVLDSGIQASVLEPARHG